jgi:hypothetical protein
LAGTTALHPPAEHEVATVQGIGWSGLTNGELGGRAQSSAGKPITFRSG